MTEQSDQPPILETEGRAHGFRVVYEQTPTTWGAYAPDLPGMGVVGNSRAEVERLIAESILIYLDELREDRAQRPWLYVPEDLSP